MTRTIQILRGTEAQNDTFTGAVGELTMDTTNNEIRIHDGSTVGGHKIGGTIKNQNTVAGAINPIYDWVGTLAEYNAQSIETLHPDWLCYITDDQTADAYEAYTKSQTNTLLANLSDEKPGFCSFNTATRVQITTTSQTAAKNGWLIGYINFSGNNKTVEIYVNSVSIGNYGWSNSSQWFAANVCLPIKAGQTYRFTCSGTVENNRMYFYPND